MASVSRIVLIGFSGTGKTTVARLLADRLGWDVADTDEAIEAEWGIPIPAIFRDHGEAAFRASEQRALRAQLAREQVVIATGGGAVADDAVWDADHLRREGTLVLALDAEPETILQRLREQAVAEGEDTERPMLAGDDPLGRIAALKGSRQHYYDAADLTLHVDAIDAAAVAAELATIVESRKGTPLTIRLDADSASSDILVGPGTIAMLGREARARWPKARRTWIVSDENVAALHAATAEEALRVEGFAANTMAVPAGEGSKSLETAGQLYDWMLGGGVERGDIVVALGGGVVGDLAGFVAATVLRGLGLVQVPTSLLAMVDSSVGGKTGINHAAGKNLIGAFLQPHLVIADTDLLQTLPPRELRAGWGEIVKHAFIQRSTPGGERGDLAGYLRRNARHLLELREPATSYLIWRNIALKAAVVAADEREMGIRAYLNFGHTLGHAIEAADYALLHGEAIAVGMVAASRLGVLAGTCGADHAEAIDELVASFGLPRTAAVDEARVLALIKSDKKRVAGRQRYVLPIDGGGVVIRDDVSEQAAAEALRSVQVDLVSA